MSEYGGAMIKLLAYVLLGTLALLFLVILIGPFAISTTPRPVLSSDTEHSIQPSDFIEFSSEGEQLDIHYRAVDGTQPNGGLTFVLLHGFTFNLYTWDPVIDFFSRHGRVVAYDQIPYGLSAKAIPTDRRHNNPYTKEATVERLFSVMDRLGVGQAILVGNSSGGTLALEAALARPERIAGLILVSPWVYSKRPNFSPVIARSPQMRRLSLFVARQLGEVPRLLELSYADPTRIDDVRRHAAGAHRQMPGWDLAWGELIDRSLYSPVTIATRIQEIRHPVLVVTGEQDRLVPPADSERTAAGIPGAEFALIDACGHVPHEECTDAFTEAVGNWLASQVNADP